MTAKKSTGGRAGVRRGARGPLRERAAGAGPRLKKRLGQHHLRDGRLTRPLVEFLEPAGRLVVEIGAGGGVLTRRLLAAGARVAAWELDFEWVFGLRARAGDGRLWPVAGDALELPWGLLPAGTLVAGNLPYGIATALIEQLLAEARGVPRAGFLVQLEVARRLAARPGEADYGALAVLAAARAEVRPLGRVAAGSFRPPPEVDGAFVGLVRRPPPLPPAEMPAFAATVRAAFAYRRKSLRNSLAAAWGGERAAEVLAALGWGRSVRAQELDLGALVELHGQARRLQANP